MYIPELEGRNKILSFLFFSFSFDFYFIFYFFRDRYPTYGYIQDNKFNPSPLPPPSLQPPKQNFVEDHQVFIKICMLKSIVFYG